MKAKTEKAGEEEAKPAKRVPVVGGNWKSNGDRDFIQKYSESVLNKSEWNTDALEVCIAPTDIHLTEV